MQNFPWCVLFGDCRDAVLQLPGASVDALVTDPPYHLTTNKKGGTGPASLNERSPAGRARIGTGFMGQPWDGGDVSFRPETWDAFNRCLKPGAHLIVFGGTRTFHRIACAIEDAGYEIRDTLMWVYGQGFPKSANQDGAWEGWGTALKPAWEPIILARKPLIGTVAKNIEKWSTGALNIDGCRIPLNGDYKCKPNGRPSQTGLPDNYDPEKANQPDTVGRWPANVVHDGSEEVLQAFPNAPGQQGDLNPTQRARKSRGVFGDMPPPRAHKARRDGEPTADKRYTKEGSTNFAALPGERRFDVGSAARFFYCAKASRAERGENNNHPTVKPVLLMRWLARLVTPPGGIIFDPFTGSGTTGIAARKEGFRFVGCEAEKQYYEFAQRRIAAALDID